MIELEDICRSFQVGDETVHALDHVSLLINPGDYISVMGPSGSGKSTLLNMLGLLDLPNAGSYRFEDRELTTLSEEKRASFRREKIGFIFQFARLIPTLSVLENILLPLSFTNNPQGDRQYALDLLERVGLGGRQDDLPGQLSGGQQRRVAIARSFINRPEIILADEPTGDLDEETEKEILAIFKDFNNQGITFLVVSHNKDLAGSQDTPRILTMKNGSISETPSA